MVELITGQIMLNNKETKIHYCWSSFLNWGIYESPFYALHWADDRIILSVQEQEDIILNTVTQKKHTSEHILLNIAIFHNFI